MISSDELFMQEREDISPDDIKRAREEGAYWAGREEIERAEIANLLLCERQEDGILIVNGEVWQAPESLNPQND